MRAAFAQQAAPQQQLDQVQVGCDSNLASVPGQGGKEYDLFKNLMAKSRGCTPAETVTYEKVDEHPAPLSGKGRAVPPQQAAPSRQQEEADRAACKSEGEQAAAAARGLRPGEYDLFKNIAAAQSGDAERVERSCMAERGYRSVAN